MNTLLINGKLNNSLASGDGPAEVSSGKSMLFPGYNNLFATNFIVSGFGVISVYMLITGLPVLIILFNFTTTKITNTMQKRLKRQHV
jgi:hypothetical protein